MTRFIFTLSAFLLILSMPSISFAKDSVGGSVKVGDKIPTNLEFKDHTGKLRSFSDLKGERGMVLVFIRSAEWCPFCQKQLLDLNKKAKEFSDAGYPVISVSYDALPQLEKFVTKNNPKITLLSDPASESIRAFGILNKASAKGTMSYGIPHPGVFIVDKNKKVQAKFFKKGVKERPSTKELLAKIKELNAPKVSPMTIEGMGQDPIAPEEQFIVTPEKLDPIILPEDIEGSATEIIPNATNQPEFLPIEIETPKIPVSDLEVMTPEITASEMPVAPVEPMLDPVEAPVIAHPVM
jgi:peroxiredoxin